MTGPAFDAEGAAGPSALLARLAALRDRRDHVGVALTTMAATLAHELTAVTALRDEVASAVAELEGSPPGIDHELDAAAHEVVAFGEHLAARARALHDAVESVHAEAAAVAHDVEGHRASQHQLVEGVAARSADLHRALDDHRAVVSDAGTTAAHALTTTAHHASQRHQALDQHLGALQHVAAETAQQGEASTRSLAGHAQSAADDLRQQLGVVGGLLGSAAERLQRSVEQTVEHEVHALVQEAVRALERLFDDLVTRLGHNHRQLLDARALIEPLLHELESIVPGLQPGADRAHAHAVSVQQQHDEASLHGGH